MTLRPWLAALLCVSCAHSAPQPTPAKSFATFADAYFAAALANIAELKAEAAEFAAIRKGELSFDDQIDAQLIDNQLAPAAPRLESVILLEKP